MDILGTFTKRTKRGKDINGKQRFQTRNYVITICSRCGKEMTREYKELSEIADKSALCNSCNKKTYDDEYYWYNKINELYGDRYNIIKIPHLGVKSRIQLVCKKHNEANFAKINDLLYSFKRQKTHNVLGPCKECKRLVRRLYTTRLSNENLRLYYIFFPDINMYKLGLSTQEKLYKRTYGKRHNIIWEYQVNYEQGRLLERYLHNKFENKRYCGIPKLLKDGNTELYIENIIPNIDFLSQIVNDSDL